MSVKKTIARSFTVETIEDGISVQAQYAPNANPTSDQIHTVWKEGDLYMRTRESDDVAWSSWHKIVGENGGETDYSFNISKEKTSERATKAPSNCFFGTWQDAPIAPTSTYPYLWMKIQKKDGNGNNVGDASYARVTGELGIDYEIRCGIDSIKIPKDATSTSVTTTFNFYYKESGKAPIAYNIYYGIYYRIGTAYTRISSGSSRGASLSSYSIDNTKTAIVVFMFSASYSGNAPMLQNYLAKLELPIYEDGKDGLTPNPNILLRTVFDRGIDKVKEKWDADWLYTTIDTASDTLVSGRKSVRINASGGSDKDFSQNVYGRIKTSTWYTLSFYYFSINDFRTFIYDGSNTHGIIDRNEGYYIDGVFHSDDIGLDGRYLWEAEWSGKRHSITFKTQSSFETSSAIILFRCYSGGQLAICMPKLEEGKDVTPYIANEDDLVGDNGARGKTGRFYYYAQEWTNSSSPLYIVTDAQAPYFSYNGDYYVFNPEQNYPNGISMQDMGTPSTASSNWKKMWNDFKYIITEAIFGAYAHFGSFIINGDWLISQHGKVGGVDSTNYQMFDPNFVKGIYLCRYAKVTVSYSNAGSATFTAGRTYQIKLVGEDITTTVSTAAKMNVRMYNGSSAVSSVVSLTATSTTAYITFTPSTTGTYYLRCDMQTSGMTGYITAIVSNVFVPNFAIDALQGTSYQHEGFFSGNIESEDVEQGNKITIDAKKGAIIMTGPTSITDEEYLPRTNERTELFKLDFFYDADDLTTYAMWKMCNARKTDVWAYQELSASPYNGFQVLNGDYNHKYGRLTADEVIISHGSEEGDKGVEISPDGVTIRRGSTYTTKTWEQIFNNQ